MPIFTRRRLQSMLDELAVHLSNGKRSDLVGRLEDKRVEQVLPAEMELALLWALAGVGDIDVEPEWWADEHRPDAYTEALLPGRSAVVEIAATNDNRISGEEAMDRIAQQISTFANSVQRGVGSFLYSCYQEESGYEGRRYYRRRLAPPDYELSTNAAELIRAWIQSGDVDRVRLRIAESGLGVQIEKKDHKQTRYHNIWSSMPPETHSIDDNPLYELLKRKLKQLAGAQPNASIHLSRRCRLQASQSCRARR